ncbi:MAG TPA: protein kinase [Gemmatimonadaceae bacterium]|nr:protein kinase [Gemmatimonadaceae bacterium]
MGEIETLTAALAGHYAIQREIGAGGMATVYLAHDVRHDRDVAIKVVHPDLGAVLGGERFLAEIKTTAKLQHPHILPLLDSGNANGLLFYVMPMVAGESLRQRLDREKQLPIPEAVRIAGEVASALDYAHRHGVIHRDIKPENILLHDGQALVADFGIALAVQSAGGARMTQTGLSLGTPQYMSPEQAMGERSIDARSDIYALGAVTYEMLAGDAPFTGSSVQAIVAKVLAERPTPLHTLRDTVPPAVEHAVLTALAKLPADRFATAAEFGQALSDDAVGAAGHRRRAHPASAAGAGAARRARWLQWAWIPAALIGVFAGTLHRPRGAEPEPPLRASLLPPTGCDFGDVATSNLMQLSPDGAAMVFVVRCAGAQSLWIRTLATGAMRALPGTANAIYPFWSPDGQSLGFFADGRLKRIDLASGAIRDLAPALNGRGGTWNRDGVILYAPDLNTSIYRVSAAGGDARPETSKPAGEARTYRLPYFLPDGRHFLFVEGGGVGQAGAEVVGELGSNRTRRLLDVPSNVAFADGRLFYVQDGALFARPFSPGTATFSGSAVAVAPGIESWPFKYIGNFSPAGDLLVYRGPLGRERRMVWFNPATQTQVAVVPPGPYAYVGLSPDGRQILTERSEPDSPLVDVWLYQLAAQRWTQFTTHPDVYYAAAWSPDGSRIAVQPAGDTVTRIVSVDQRPITSYASGLTGPGLIDTWSPDGSFAVGTRQVTATGFDLIRFRFAAQPAGPEVLLAAPGDQMSPRISPSGRLLAYLSNQTGDWEVYLTALPDADGQQPVSQNGAWSAGTGQADPLTWSRDGRTLYFVDATQHLMSAAVAAGPPVQIGRPTPVPGAPVGVVSLSAAPDGRLLLLYDDNQHPVPATVIANWPAILRSR